MEEIERRIHEYEKEYEKLARYEIWITARELEIKIKELKNLYSFLKSKEQNLELDEEDIINYVHSKFYYDKDFDGYGHSEMRPVFTREDLIELAKHFFELGLRENKL